MDINQAFQEVVKRRMARKGINTNGLAGNGLPVSSAYEFMKPGHRVSMMMADKIANRLDVSLALLIKEAKALQQVEL